MLEKVREQILTICDTRLANMFNIPMVQKLAFEWIYYELVCWIEDRRREYVRFIMYGER